MGALSCNCIKRDTNASTTISIFPEETQDEKIVKSVKCAQQTLPTHTVQVTEPKKQADVHIQLESLRPDLKEIFPEVFKPSLSEKVQEIIRNIGPFILTDEEENYLKEARLLKSNPMLFQNNFIYIGTWNADGKREGLGITYLPEGGMYEGFYKDDLMNGRGRLINIDGDYYEGYFKDDRANGYGKYVSCDNVVYRGEWKDDKQDGKGEEIYPNNSSYEGYYSRGSKNGKGKFTWPDGSQYEGDFKDNALHGKGVYKWSDGRIYSGTWVNNKMDGYGEFKWPDGKKYIGEYKQDKKWGFGRFEWPLPNEKIYEGGWFCGKQQGHGVMIQGGRKRYGEWKMGKILRWFEESEVNYNAIVKEIKTKAASNVDDGQHVQDNSKSSVKPVF